MLPALLAGVLSAIACSGCTTSTVRTSDGLPMPPEPRRAPVVPADTNPNRMALLVGQSEDSDGNGYPDLINVTAALFATEFNSAIVADGAFEIILYKLGDAHRTGAQPVATWRLGPEQIADVRANALYGPCYQLKLSLLEFGSDRKPATQCDIRGRYIPANGSPTIRTSEEVRLVQMGRRDFR